MKNKNPLKWIRHEIKVLTTYLNCRKCKREANNLHKLTGKRYHVIALNNNKFKVVDNTFVDKYNKLIKGKNRKITINDLLKMSYYSTSTRSITKNTEPNGR
jgi:hypothetical protein